MVTPPPRVQAPGIVWAAADKPLLAGGRQRWPWAAPAFRRPSLPSVWMNTYGAIWRGAPRRQPRPRPGTTPSSRWSARAPASWPSGSHSALSRSRPTRAPRELSRERRKPGPGGWPRGTARRATAVHPPRARRPQILVRVQIVRPTMGFYHSFRGPRTHRRILHPEHRLEPICGGRPRGTRGPACQGWQREARGGAVVSMYSRVLDCHSARPEYGVLSCGRS